MFKTFKYISLKNLLRAENLPVIILVLFFFSEAGTTIAHHFRHSFHNYSLVIKAVFLFVVVAQVLKRGSQHKKVLYFLTAMWFVFLIGQFSFNNYSFGQNFFANSVIFARYIFVFIVLLFLSDRRNQLNPVFFTVYEKIVVINCVLVILAIVFDISVFKTYYHRFGASGVFMTPSMITYFNALALTYFSYQYLTKNEKLLELLLVAIACLLAGTKALLLFVALTGVHLLIVKKFYRSKVFYASVIAVIAALYVFRDSVVSVVQKNTKLLTEVYHEHGWITALTSYRDQNLKEDFFPVIKEKWNGVNYLFGGTDFEIYRVEFEPFDVFLFFGIIGACAYFIFYFRKVMVFKQFDIFGKIQMVFLLIIVMVSGNFFNNAPMALYLLIVISVLRMDTMTKRAKL